MIDVSTLGWRFDPERTFKSEAVAFDQTRMLAFARSVGERDPIYLDPEAARIAGYRALPAPPTYVFCLKLEVAHPKLVLKASGFGDLQGVVLHAEQAFEYFDPPFCAGDVVSFEDRVAEVASKRGGALTFITLETRILGQTGEDLGRIWHVEAVKAEVAA